MQPVAVAAEAVRPLRQRILRPGQAAERLCYPGDGDADTLHAAVREDDMTLAVASVMRDPYPSDPRPQDWRIRGMATVPQARGRGLGAALLDRCEQHARSRGGRRLWCNARTPARGFYERAGMVVDGEEFELPGIGPHLLMSKPLAAA